MLSALLTALILLAVWCVPAAVAETASEGDDSAYDESGDPSTGYLYGSIAYLNGNLYFSPMRRTVCFFPSRCPAARPWSLG